MSRKLYSKVMETALLTGSILVPAVESKAAELVKYAVEDDIQTASFDKTDIVVVNNVGKVKDTVTVKNLKVKDVVKVYAENGKTILGMGTASKTDEVTIQLKTQLVGETTVYVSVTNVGKLESNLKPVNAEAEAVSTRMDATLQELIDAKIASFDTRRN